MTAAPGRPAGPIRRLLWWARDYACALSGQLRARLSRVSPGAFAGGDPALPVVLLLPGVYEGWRFLLPLARALSRAGFEVRVAPELGSNRAPVAAGAARVIAGAAAALPRDRPVLLVAHSKGGLIGRVLLDQPGSPLAGRADARLLAVATPFRGSPYAALFWNRPIRSLRPRDRFFAELLAGDAAPNARVTALVPRFDPHVPPGELLPGARVQPMRTAGHFWSVRSRAGTAEIVAAALAIACPPPGCAKLDA